MVDDIPSTALVHGVNGWWRRGDRVQRGEADAAPTEQPAVTRSEPPRQKAAEAEEPSLQQIEEELLNALLNAPSDGS